jgi:hypothetical protein
VASSAYWKWLDAGKPYRLARPIEELKRRARAAGVRWLGDLGNDAHLQAVPPEDHTPFSATARPVPLPGYVVTAIDFADGGHFDRMVADARAGRIPWLKYINGRGVQYSSRDGFKTARRSSDHHTHVSIHSDWCDRSIGQYDPFRATAPGPIEGGIKPMFMVQKFGDPTVFVSDGFQYRGIDWDTFLAYRDTLHLSYVLVQNDRELAARAGRSWDADTDAAPAAAASFPAGHVETLQDAAAAAGGLLSPDAVAKVSREVDADECDGEHDPA